jgi:amino-acid racemase
MRTIGLLGGMSWESTAEYYRLANQLVAERLGGLHSARCVVWSVDFADAEPLQAQDRWDEAGELLAVGARGLEAAGADLLLLCTNTMHRVAGAVRGAVGIPFVDIVEVTAAAAQRAGAGTVGLLGTRYTMEHGFYRERLEEHGLRVLVPGHEDRELVHRVIYDELCRGVVREESRAGYLRVIDELAGRGADAVALACTEIELLVDAGHTGVPLLPTTRLHVEAAVDLALADG